MCKSIVYDILISFISIFAYSERYMLMIRKFLLYYVFFKKYEIMYGYISLLDKDDLF